MASRTYQNFDLLVEDEGAGTFRARVTSSPLDESPSVRFTLPFDAAQLELLLLRLDPGRSGTRRAAGSAQAQACLDLGGALFDTVFVDDVRMAWTRSQDLARQQGDGLRLRLRLAEAPAIAGLPWELLHDRRSNTFVAQSERTPVVRFLEVTHPPRPLAVSGPLRVLVVISSPTDLPELDVDAEWRRVEDTLASRVSVGRLHLDRLETPTRQALRDWLRVNDVHILHFIGHGDFDDQLQDGVLYFTDRFGRSAKVSPSLLGPVLGDHDPLRLVVLNACHSARVDAQDPFSGMAQGLIQQDCAAVVAMQFPISDGAAVTFTGEFYRALADGFPVDQAVTSARKSLLDEYAAEWATPVVFLRAPDGHVFTEIVAKPPLGAPTPVEGVEHSEIVTVDDEGHEVEEPEPVVVAHDSASDEVPEADAGREDVVHAASGRGYAAEPFPSRMPVPPRYQRRQLVVAVVVVVLLALATWGIIALLRPKNTASSGPSSRALAPIAVMLATPAGLAARAG